MDVQVCTLADVCPCAHTDVHTHTDTHTQSKHFVVHHYLFLDLFIPLPQFLISSGSHLGGEEKGAVPRPELSFLLLINYHNTTMVSDVPSALNWNNCRLHRSSQQLA